ncbi:TolC family protein [Chryseobacterium sp.]|uniref:TolC family protein n=1 Tax=Chryseobacterium sp. TaxID=1871047 RepID=UPI0011CACC4C|nr:TolC family protein [Chryseobacterium sp.]TXF78820.1 TolC family protein [Chryseobacterium sp.]
MIRKILLITLFGVIIHNAVFFAQERHTLRQMWSETETNYAGAKAAESAVIASVLNAKAVKANALPQVRIQYQNTYGTFEGSSGGFFPQPGTFNVSGNTISGASAVANNFGSATAEYELYNFGRQKSEEKAAAFFTEKVKTDREVYLLKLKKEVSQRYLDWIFYGSKLSWAEKNSQRLAEIHTVSKALSRSGLKPEADSALTYSSYVQALAMQDNLMGRYRAATEKLKEFLRRDLHTEDMDRNDFLNPEMNLTKRDSAVSEHPFVRALQYESEYYQAKAEAQTKAALPSLKMLGGYAYRGTGINRSGYASGSWYDGFSNSTNNVLVGLGMTWNISSVYTNSQKSGALTKEAERLGYLRDQYQLALSVERKALQENLAEKQKQLLKEAGAVKAASQAYEMYSARYKSGLITLIELLQIRTILENTETTQLDASREYWQQVISEAELTADFEYLFNNL